MTGDLQPMQPACILHFEVVPESCTVAVVTSQDIFGNRLYRLAMTQGGRTCPYLFLLDPRCLPTLARY